MGVIRRRGQEGTQHYLHAHHTVGRGRQCDLVIERSAVSVQHAVVRWSREGWTVRDLGSRNGTFVNGQRVAAGAAEALRLKVGDELVFAERDEVWEVVDDAPPGSLLVPTDGEGRPDVKRPPYPLDPTDVVGIPSAAEPTASAYQRSGRWYLESPEGLVELVDGEPVEVGGERFVVHLASPATGTLDAEQMLVDRVVKNARLRIEVAADEESAGLCVEIGRDRHELPPRTFLYLLAYLARERLEATQKGALDEDAGWVPVESACRDLQLSSAEALGLLVHRCRKAIQELGLDDPASIVDRSRRGLLRIGVPAAHLRIEPT